MRQISLFSHLLPIATISLVSAIAIAKPARADSFTIKVDPRETYLHLTSDPLALDTVAIDLASLGINGGDFITLEQLGDFSFRIANDSPDIITGMTGVFSTSAELLPSEFLNRVSGAIEFGNDVITTPLNLDFNDNDIAEDFLIEGEPFNIQVPDLAQYLFVAAKDQYWGDNGDPDNDFALRITTEQQSVPEPSTILGLLLFGGLGIGKVLHRKKSF
ncbi:MAG: PEP-CTERM sorting domain-containing protein [Cyanobacteria bacterium SBLK]|nr:PEP-CTERM sorting domain-containing protein [Cyanobacteria bacterium SBLK]